MEIDGEIRVENIEILSELSRATTVYHEATPDVLEPARQQYEEALRKFNLNYGGDSQPAGNGT